MGHTMNRLYVNDALHLYTVNFSDNQITFLIMNLKQLDISQVVLALGKEQFTFDIQSNEMKLYLRIPKPAYDVDITMIELISYVAGGAEVVRSQNDYIVMSPAKSVFIHRPYHLIYQSLIAKKVNKNNPEIEYIPEKTELYWNCSCGAHNPALMKVCETCGIKDDSLRLDNIPFEEEIKKARDVKLIYRFAFWWLLVSFVIQVLYEALVGDFLFINEVKNQFLGVFNRMVIPVFLISAMQFLIWTKLHVQKRRYKFLQISVLVLFIYLNLMNVFYFIGSSYNFIFLLSLNLVVLISVMIHFWLNRKQQKERTILFLVTSILFVIQILSLHMYSIYEITVKNKGLYLMVHTTDEIYQVPETIGGLKVTEVAFGSHLSYDIQTLKLSKNIEKVHYASAIVLNHLETIEVDPNNPNFYVENNILFHQNGRVRMVPIYTETLFIDDPIIETGPFKDLIHLKTLTIGSHVEIIKAEAFANAIALETLVFENGSSVKEIGDYAFANAHSLKEVHFPISLVHLGLGVLSGANQLETLNTPFLGAERETTDELYRSHDILVYFFGSKTYLHNSLIPKSLKEVIVYDVLRIHNVTFYHASSVERIILPNTMTNLGIQSFYYTTSLIEMIIPDGVIVIPESAFEGSGIESITIPATVTVIEKNAFKNTALIEVIYLGDPNLLEIDPEGNSSIISIIQ